MICLNSKCNKEFDVDYKGRKFCSRSCAATYNNTKYPKRVSKYKDNDNFISFNSYKYKKRCPICGESMCQESKTCILCKKALTVERQYQTLLKDVTYMGNSRIKYSQVRKLARKFLDLWEIPQKCKICGYDLHVQACHLISISEFNVTSRLIDVNGPGNLIYLCPNHHWELDNGYLVL